MNIQGARVADPFIPPHLIQQIAPFDHRAVCLLQGHQQIVFPLGEGNRRALAGYGITTLVDFDAADMHNRPAGLGRALLGLEGDSPQIGADASQQFPEAEGFDDIIVGSQLQPQHPIQLLAPGRQHQNRHSALPPNFPADLPALHLRHHHIQQQQVGCFALGQGQGLCSVVGSQNAIALFFQLVAQGVYDHFVVVCHQNRLFRHAFSLPSH